MTKTVVLIGTAAVVGLATGCSSSRLSHDGFVKQADAICTSYEAAVKKLRTPRTLTEVERYTNRVLPLYRSALAELAALEPPTADEPAVRQWLRIDRAIGRDLRELAAAAHARQIPRAQAVVKRAGADNARSNRIARRLGLTVCPSA